MFVRKLVVIFVPLLLAGLLCWLVPYIAGTDFGANVLLGGTLGVSLVLLLPLSGASRRREPFAGLLWVPLMVLCIVLAAQYMAFIGIEMSVLELFRTGHPQTVLVESAFIGYMAVQVFRTKK